MLVSLVPQRRLRFRTSPVRSRGVSPIIATILLVAITVVLAAVLYVLVSGLVHGPGTAPIGTALAMGSPAAGTCWTGGKTHHICGTSGDRLWNLSVQESQVELGDILVQVHTSAGAMYKTTVAGGFSIMIPGSTKPVAYYSVKADAGLAMTSGFTYATGYSSTTKVTSLMSLVIGTGTAVVDWQPGQGNYVSIVGTTEYSGVTAPVVLP